MDTQDEVIHENEPFEEKEPDLENKEAKHKQKGGEQDTFQIGHVVPEIWRKHVASRYSRHTRVHMLQNDQKR